MFELPESVYTAAIIKNYRPIRRCEEPTCGKKLSLYNKKSHCYGCIKKMQDAQRNDSFARAVKKEQRRNETPKPIKTNKQRLENRTCTRGCGKEVHRGICSPDQSPSMPV
jgi:hypothetical protein